MGHVEAARDVANQMGGDRNDYGLAFGPSNVAQHEIAVAVELEDGGEAVRRAARIKFPNSMPPVRYLSALLAGLNENGWTRGRVSSLLLPDGR